jgi:Na+/melibiose symporter-like transporter
MTINLKQIWSHVGYGTAELGVSAIESFLRLYLLIYLTSSVGLSADLAGYAVSIGVLWDAVTDPIMGRISDRTRSRWGQRLPWMVIGAPLLALAFVLMFSLTPIPSGESPWPLFWQVTGLNILLNTAMTMVAVPHLALGNELSDETCDDRTTLYAWRSMMTLLGFLVGIIIPSTFNASGAKLSKPEFIFSILIAGIFILATCVTILACRKRLKVTPEVQLTRDLQIRNIVTGKVARLMVAFFIATFAQGLNSVLAMYYYRFTLSFNDQTIGKMLIVFVLSLCVTIPLWVWAASRYSKVILIGLGTGVLGIISSIFYPLFEPEQILGPFLMALVGGSLLGSSGLLESLLVDSAEEQKIEAQAMGLVFGLWKFMAKAARAIAIALGGKLLTVSGYTPSQAPSKDVLENIALLFGPGVGVFFLATGIFLIVTRTKKPHI